MINYKLGEESVKIEFNDFLSISYNGIKKYKSDFEEFSNLYEFIDKNIHQITHIFFDNYEYFLENGVLHNLYGPAIIKHIKPSEYMAGGKSCHFFINGKRVYTKPIDTERGCRKIENFKPNNELFFFKRLTNDTNGRLIKSIDYETYPIDLNNLILKDQRKKKLLHIYDRKQL